MEFFKLVDIQAFGLAVFLSHLKVAVAGVGE